MLTTFSSNNDRVSLKILYAEDNKIDFLFYESVIKDALSITHDIEIENCDSAKELEEKLGSDNEYDLIILDLNLIDSKGTETFRKVKKACRKSTPIIIVTGLDNAKVKSECIKAGAGSFMVKKVNDNNLVGTILSFTFNQEKMKKSLKYLGADFKGGEKIKA